MKWPLPPALRRRWAGTWHPALDLLASHPAAELYILELSSFQLETTPSLGARCAAFLNLSEDHLDRHGDMHGYRAAKQRIFIGAESAVVNANEPLTWPTYPVDQVAYFSQRAPEGNAWGLALYHNKLTLMQGSDPWMAIDELKIAGQHNYLNALAALAMGQALGFAAVPMCSALGEFKGLEHRSEVIAHINGVTWVNDTKGTNVGATLAAINGIGATLEGRLILLAGGVGKGADFSPLAEPLSKCARHVLLFGLDAPRLADALVEHVSIRQVEDLTQAMEAAFELAQPGDCVLLSPACASLDQFANYQQRGDVFRHWVQQRHPQQARGAMSRLQRLRTTLSTRDLPCDVWLIVAAVALAGLGWVMVSSASIGLLEDTYHYSRQHGVFLVLAIIACVFMLCVPLEVWRQNAALILLASIFLLIVVLMVGQEINGSKRWIALPGPLPSLQVSEFAKVGLIFLHGGVYVTFHV
ncbi:hypothetical protein HORIV_26620 [Vreelandella olivaria]|uniref:UDP-N-acetylmuramoylalanine--D-glutamate ligase n=1 Tax=Vreelandella olivaria TaxID=390919 RepID=A0ABN5WTG0_9GAMM|nr:hypothetical protein HORIV_26620 [Halomonas olivaria]